MTRIAAFDLDDTLIDSWSHFSTFLQGEGFCTKEMEKGSYIALSPEMLTRFHAEESLGKERAAANALEACSALRDAGWELHIVTARSEWHRDRTLEMVGNAFGDLFTGIHCVGGTTPKWQMLHMLGAEFFADDHPTHVAAAHERGIPSVLFGDLPWNRSSLLLPRVADWTDILNQKPWEGIRPTTSSGMFGR